MDSPVRLSLLNLRWISGIFSAYDVCVRVVPEKGFTVVYGFLLMIGTWNVVKHSFITCMIDEECYV